MNGCAEQATDIEIESLIQHEINALALGRFYSERQLTLIDPVAQLAGEDRIFTQGIALTVLERILEVCLTRCGFLLELPDRFARIARRRGRHIRIGGFVSLQG